MTTNCYAVVDAQNQTLWTGASTDFKRAALSFKALQDKSLDQTDLHLILSHEDKTGKEMLVEIMTPLAKDYLAKELLPKAQGATIEVWHEKNPRFGMDEMLGATSYPPQESDSYSRVADISVPLGVDPASATNLLLASPLEKTTEDAIEEALEIAFRYSQNIDASWRPGTGCRSTSMGDVLVFKCCGFRQAFKVRAAGFMAIEFR